jgi:hypothetical protein
MPRVPYVTADLPSACSRRLAGGPRDGSPPSLSHLDPVPLARPPTSMSLITFGSA